MVGRASAQQTITYTDGETNAASIAITAAANPTTLMIASGTATQSGAISDSGTAGQIDLTGGGTLILTGANTYSGGTTISAGTLQVGNSGTVGSITGDIADNSAVEFDRNDTITYGGIISGTGSVSQLGLGPSPPGALYFGIGTPGTGILIFTGNNTYMGGTTISVDSTLQIGNGGTTGSIVGNVNGVIPGFISGSTLAFDRSDTITFGGQMDTSINLTQMGSGTLIITGATGGTFPYGSSTNTVTISSGTLQVGNGGTSGSLAGNVVNNSSLVFNRSDTFTYGLGGSFILFGPANSISGTGSVTQIGSGTLILAGANTYSGGTTISAGTLEVEGSLGTGNVVDNALLVTLGGFPISNNISGTGSVTQNGTGPLSGDGTGLTLLSGANSYTGGTAITNGTLEFSQTTAMPASGAVAVGNTGTLAVMVGSGTGQFTNGTTGNGTVGGLLAGLGGQSGSTVTWSAGSGLGLDTTNAVGGFSYGVIADTSAGALSLVKLGTGTLSLTGDNTYTGSTTVLGGVLVLSGNNTNAGGTTISAGTLQVGNGGTTGNITGNVTDNAALVFDRSDTVSYGGLGSALSGNGSLTQMGAGTLNLSSIGNFTGTMTISSGTIQTNSSTTGNILDDGSLVYSTNSMLVASSAISGTGGLTVTANSGSTVLIEGADTYTGGTTISSGELVVGNAGTFVTGGNNDGVSGSIVGDVTDNANLAFDRNDAVTFGGNISGTGSLFKYADNTLILTGTNTFTGTTGNSFVVNGVTEKAGTYVLGGTLQIGNGGTTGSIAGDVVDGVSGLGAGANSTLAFDRSDSITFAGGITGVGQMVQMGSGTLTLTGANTYTGGTTVTAGTLLANSSNSTGSGAVGVMSGGSLGGNGAISTSGVTSGAAVTFASGSTLNQSSVTGGLGISTLTFNLRNTGVTTTVNLLQGAKFAYDLGASGVNDQAVVTGGTLTLNGQNFSDFTFTAVNGFTGTGTYNLISTDASGDILGLLGNTSGIVDGYNATLSVYNSEYLQLTLNGEAVPEPSTWALMLCGIILVAVLRARTRSTQY